MALNGITIHALCHELNEKLSQGKVQKISQPEERGILITVHTANGQERLYISANPSLPLLYLTKENRPSPLTAPNFLMVLRKYIGNARILSVTQMGLERVVCIELEHLNELKDVARKKLYVEIMGKHSNIIFTDESDHIIDAIKHVGITQSSVRLVLPGKEYFIPAQEDRMDAFEIDKEGFFNRVLSRKSTLEKAISSSFVGFSKLTGAEISARSGLDGDIPLDTLHSSERELVYEEFKKLVANMENHNYSPRVILDHRGKSIEFSPFDLLLYPGNERISCDSISEAISIFYSKKNSDNLIRQKTADLKKIINTCIERNTKKLALQSKQLEDSEKASKLQLYGELLQIYGYSIEPGAKKVELTDYHDDSTVIIPLDPDLNGIENSKKYFEKYDKTKRTKEALLPQVEHTKNELSHLYTILCGLEMCENESDISEIKKELSEFGFIKKRTFLKGEKKEKKNPPLHFTTEDGFELFVGKNNYQNEEVTFKIGKGNDWWFHAKQMPGSHVILKNDGREIPDEVFEIAANLAAYYSQGRDSNRVEIDYVQRKEVKKTPKSAPGYVIYYTNYSMMAEPDISRLSKLP